MFDEEKTTSVDLDSLIEGLSSDIRNVNNFMEGLNEQKKANKEIEKSLVDERKKLERDKQDFEDYVRRITSELEETKKTNEVILNAQKLNLSKAEANFKENMDNTLSELELVKKELELRESKFKEDKEQFEKYKDLELSRINHEKEILQADKEQFEKYREVNNKRIEIENKNLEQQFNKFRQVIDQFNVNFKSADSTEE